MQAITRPILNGKPGMVQLRILKGLVLGIVSGITYSE